MKAIYLLILILPGLAKAQTNYAEQLAAKDSIISALQSQNDDLMRELVAFSLISYRDSQPIKLPKIVAPMDLSLFFEDDNYRSLTNEEVENTWYIKRVEEEPIKNRCHLIDGSFPLQIFSLSKLAGNNR